MIDPEQLRVLAQRFDWAFERDGDVLDLDSVAEILRALADDVPPEEIGDGLDLPNECTDPDDLDA